MPSTSVAKRLKPYIKNFTFGSSNPALYTIFEVNEGSEFTIYITVRVNVSNLAYYKLSKETRFQHEKNLHLYCIRELNNYINTTLFEHDPTTGTVLMSYNDVFIYMFFPNSKPRIDTME